MSSDAPAPEPYSRPHDPALCDLLICEGFTDGDGAHLAQRAVMLGVPDAPPERQTFDDDETTGHQMSHTVIGAPAWRKPAPPAGHADPVCTRCGAPYVDGLTPEERIPGVFCDGRCELDVEI